MKNTDIFSLRRFGKYFVSDLKTATANFGMSMLLIGLFSIVLYAINASINLLSAAPWEGPDEDLRFFIFGVAGFVLFTSMPVKCYGKITERKYGSEWLLLPASAYEKSLSMIILTAFAAPLTGAGLYLATDAIICALDPTCGRNLIYIAGEFIQSIANPAIIFSDGELESFPALCKFVHSMMNPVLYIDDIIMVSLTFLLGAICFKTRKTGKTIIAIAIASTAVSMAAAPFISGMASKFSVAFASLQSPETLDQMIKSSWILNNAALIDTINDTLINIALVAAIFFRIKTLKH